MGWSDLTQEVIPEVGNYPFHVNVLYEWLVPKGEVPRKREYGLGVTSEQHVLNQYAATYKT